MVEAALDVAETAYDASASDEDFAYVPEGGAPSGRKLKIGDAVHTHEAVVAVANGSYRGNELQIPESAMSAVKARVASAVHKFFSGDEQKRLLDWLHSGKKPESVKEIRLSTPAFAFKGTFPDVPLAPGVDRAALTVGDPNPLFVVRPLAVVGAVSDNGLKYDAALVNEIKRQVLLKKPAARQGHVSEESSSWEFPPDVGLWVGAEMFGNTLYGKAYIYPNTPFHQMVVKRKAAGSTLSNSIWGKGHFETNADGTQKLTDLDLESIDFSPAERAALEALGGQFETTSEMKPTGEKPMADQTHDDKAQDLALIRDELAKHVKEMAPHALHEMMSKEQRQHCAECTVREMEPTSLYEMLPAGHRKHISDSYVKEFGSKMAPAAEMDTKDKETVSETTRQLAEMQTRVAQMESVIAQYREKEYNDALDAASALRFAAWKTVSIEGTRAIASAKDTFKMFIVAQMATMEGGASLQNINAAAETAWPRYEPQAALLKTALSGGNVIVGAQGTVAEQQGNAYGYDPKTGRYDPERATAARAKVMGG